jgi:hypothetical protein
MTGFVYFIECAAASAIKIGFSTEVARRLSTLQSGSPTPLVLLLAVPGTAEDETRLHTMFAGERRSGEWFNADGPVRTFVDLLARLPEEGAAEKLRSEPSLDESVCWHERQEEAAASLRRLKEVVLAELGSLGAQLIREAQRM